MDKISTTIKKKYMSRILRGKKKTELKGAIDYWKRRLHKLCGSHNGDLEINFLCGRTSYKFDVLAVTFYKADKIIDETFYDGYYEIKLGERIYDPTMDEFKSIVEEVKTWDL